VAPHVLHHAGPLAGAALLAGFGGKAIFFALGLLLSVPMLRRLYRRFGTLIAPALAVVAFAAVFSFSSLVIAPRLTGSENAPTQAPSVEQPSGHDSHHPGGGK
jgi:glucose dehydrogenase